MCLCIRVSEKMKNAKTKMRNVKKKKKEGENGGENMLKFVQNFQYWLFWRIINTNNSFR